MVLKGFMDKIKQTKQGRKLYIDAGKDLKIHKISKSVTTYLLRKIDLEMLPHLKTNVNGKCYRSHIM